MNVRNDQELSAKGKIYKNEPKKNQSVSDENENEFPLIKKIEDEDQTEYPNDQIDRFPIPTAPITTTQTKYMSNIKTNPYVRPSQSTSV